MQKRIKIFLLVALFVLSNILPNIASAEGLSKKEPTNQEKSDLVNLPVNTFENLNNASIKKKINVGEKQFDSFEEAINSIDAEGTVTINGNIYVYDPIRIPNGKKITITDNGSQVEITKGGAYNIQPLFVVEEGAELTFKGTSEANLIINVDQHCGLGQNVNSTGNIVHNSGVLNLKMATLDCGSFLDKAQFMGSIYVDNGATFNMSGGIIKGMIASSWYVSPVFVGTGGTFNMSGGAIRDNKNSYNENLSGGGGVLLFVWGQDEEMAKMNMSGGVIENNVAYHGGGVYQTGNTSFTMTGGSIQGNKAIPQGTDHGGDGGGVCVSGQSEVHMRDKTFFTLDGGSIKNNSARNGGGILSNCRGVELKKGNIEGNIAQHSDTDHWSGHGGGVYITNAPYSVKISNAVITENEVKGELGNTYINGIGGGIWACPTGSYIFKVTEGLAIFDNKAIGENSAGDDIVKVNIPITINKGIITLPNRMLGGGKVEWYKDGAVTSDHVGIVDRNVARYDKNNPGDPVTLNQFEDNVALKAIVSDAAKERALEEAKVIIRKNKAAHGGGIGANGNVIQDPKEDWSLKVIKEWEDKIKEADKKEVEVFLKINGKILDSIKLNKDNNWRGEFKNLPDQETIKGKLIDVIEGERYIDKDGKEKVRETSKWKVEYNKKVNKPIIEIKLTNKELPPWNPPYIPPKTPKIEVDVVKKWIDSKGNAIENPVNSIKVELYRNGIATGKIIELNKSNNWMGKFSDLEKGSSNGNFYYYTIKEVGDSGLSIDFDGRKFIVEYKGDMDQGFTILNKQVPEEPNAPPNTPPEEPNKPNKPIEPPTPPNNPNPPESPRTGDIGEMTLYVGLMLLSLVGTSLILMKKKIK